MNNIRIAAIRNQAFKRLRSETSHRKRIEGLPTPLGEDGIAGFDNDVEAWCPELDRKAVRAAMPELAPRQREVIEWRLFEGLTIRETAERMGCSESRVREAQVNAIRVLRKRLTQSGEVTYDFEE